MSQRAKADEHCGLCGRRLENCRCCEDCESYPCECTCRDCGHIIESCVCEEMDLPDVAAEYLKRRST